MVVSSAFQSGRWFFQNQQKANLFHNWYRKLLYTDLGQEGFPTSSASLKPGLLREEKQGVTLPVPQTSLSSLFHNVCITAEKGASPRCLPTTSYTSLLYASHLSSSSLFWFVQVSRRLWLSSSSPSRDVTWAFAKVLSSPTCCNEKRAQGQYTYRGIERSLLFYSSYPACKRESGNTFTSSCLVKVCSCCWISCSRAVQQASSSKLDASCCRRAKLLGVEQNEGHRLNQ